jgi:hypothetical protein
MTMKTIWNFLGNIKITFALLMAASMTLLTGSFYAEQHFSLFAELNRLRIQDWFGVHSGTHPELVWWIPVLFGILGVLGLNTFVCASNRVARLIRQRHGLTTGRFFFLLIPSLIHLLFIVLMLGHLTTFTTASWQTVALEAGKHLTAGQTQQPYQVHAIQDRFYPGTSALRDRISQTTVTLMNPDQESIQLKYAQPVFKEGLFFFLDRVKKRGPAVKERRLTSTSKETNKETCDKSPVYIEQNLAQPEGRVLLLIVSDPGLVVILVGLTLIMGLMLGYFISKPFLSAYLGEKA